MELLKVLKRKLEDKEENGEDGSVFVSREIPTNNLPSKKPKKPTQESSSKKKAKIENINFASIHLLGALKGDIIRGVSTSDGELVASIKEDDLKLVKGVVLRISRGGLRPGKEARKHAETTFEGKHGKGGWAKQLANYFSISHSRAQEQINMMQSYEIENENGFLGSSGTLISVGNQSSNLHTINGEEVRLQIVEGGAWSIYPQIVEWVDEEKEITPRELWHALNDGKKESGKDQNKNPGPYAMRMFLFVHVSSNEVEHKPGDTLHIRVCDILTYNEDCVYYDLVAEQDTNSPSLLRTALTASGKQIDANDAYLLSQKCIEELFEYNIFSNMSLEQLTKDLDTTFEILNHSEIGAGALKSLLQKALRFHSEKTQMPFCSKQVDTSIVLIVTFTLLCSIKSSFVPDLNTHVRGCTAAFKRLAVTMIEDAWPEMSLLTLMFPNSTINCQSEFLCSLLGVSLATIRMSSYFPSHQMIISGVKLAIACHMSHLLIAWRSYKNKVEWKKMNPANYATLGFEKMNSNHNHLQMSARLLRIVRSFESDMQMFDLVAECSRKNSDYLLIRKADGFFLTMPLFHFIDQHVYRGVSFTTLRGESTFAGRHESIWENVAGINPRLGMKIDETKQEVKICRLQQHMVGSLLLRSKSIQPSSSEVMKMKMDVDFGILASGAGELGPFHVTTTKEQNLKEGLASEKNWNWKLLVILGIESNQEIVLHNPNARENEKKPHITATARRLAIEQCRKKRFKFSSPILTEFSYVEYNNTLSKEGWTLYSKKKDVKPVLWSYDKPHSIEFCCPKLPKVLLVDIEIANEDAMLNILRNPKHRGLCENYKEVVENILTQIETQALLQKLIPRTLQLRFLSMLQGKYEEIAMPTPAKDGGIGADQLLAMEGDWIVYLCLLGLSHAAPSALSPKAIPKFHIHDSRVLRILEDEIASLIVAAPVQSRCVLFQKHLYELESKFGTKEIDGREPFDYQINLVDKMLHRDQHAVVKPRGHFINLDTGLGKTFVALYYAMKYGAISGNVEQILWFTPKTVVNSSLEEFCTAWKLPTEIVHIVDPSNPVIKSLINLISIHSLSESRNEKREKIEGVLLKKADSSIAVIDEVHHLYCSSIRTSIVRQVAAACPKFVCMTATPTPSRSQPIGEAWLADSVGFPLNKNNFLVGAAQMVAARVSLPIESNEIMIPVKLSLEKSQAHMEFLRNGGNWTKAAKTVREACIPTIIEKSIEIADKDPGGGVLIFMDNASEASDLLKKIENILTTQKKSYKAAYRANSEHDTNVRIAVTTKEDTSGYNFVRMGAIITGVYAQSSASRHQMRGRIRRVGQKRSSVDYFTIFPENTILSMLLQRHNSVDAKNASLETLAKEFIKNKK